MLRLERHDDPIPSLINPMTYKRLYAFLRSFMVVGHRDFEPDLGRLLKSRLCEKRLELLREGQVSRQAFFVSRGLVYATYRNPQSGAKVVYRIFRAGEIAVIAESFMNGWFSGSGLEAVEDTMLLYVTDEDMARLYKDFPDARELALKVVAALGAGVRERDELLKLKGRDRILEFFRLYPALLRGGRQAPMMYRDIAGYLHMTEFNFCVLMRGLYPGRR